MEGPASVIIPTCTACCLGSTKCADDQTHRFPGHTDMQMMYGLQVRKWLAEGQEQEGDDRVEGTPAAYDECERLVRGRFTHHVLPMDRGLSLEENDPPDPPPQPPQTETQQAQRGQSVSRASTPAVATEHSDHRVGAGLGLPIGAQALQ